MKIRVPATSANLGPGFDSCGVALSSYLTIEIIEEDTKWTVDHELGDAIPHDEQNLLIQTAQQVASGLKPQHLKMTSSIPIARGLGSSSSIIVAGIELANRLENLNLTERQKIEIATSIEGHPDNCAPAICGDFVVASYFFNQNKPTIHYVKHYFPECQIIAYIPHSQVLTKESRSVLPETLSFEEAVKASSIANVMIAAVLNGDLRLAGKMMEQDRWHEAYRQEFVPHLATIREIVKRNEGYAAFLSGAGPTVLILTSEEKSDLITFELEQMEGSAQIEQLSVDREGVQVF
ncbi:homoserine kinase [Tetragenococcus koreensis]|uniref:homoserine kinase n=1 Tax=Tetragenococcus koreensis TaxID=290335 RepID=UPI001F317ACF|nr:homoserine kinase [Tetragenococcus koreensis]MCF1584707.1 homoserine kinase [Tetragenococcus koreensis]MCF1614323.1 homoserine kinase [Tetragenococcus koreensis]MCF1624101.1 homoserine kinase [Tetragenococcus koreensis]MCF1629086.1 homoserine kinase [Tetragenococcus koreensis]MCF1641994.1 homoserine kinase [Tetragenococcus koreensis]